MREPKADDDWGTVPWPGEQWVVAPVAPHQAVPEVDWAPPEVYAVLLGPDGEPLVRFTTERTFGFARYLEEEYESES